MADERVVHPRGLSIASKDRKKWWIANLEANGFIEPEFVEAALVRK
jgi:hypothetical protein